MYPALLIAFLFPAMLGAQDQLGKDIDGEAAGDQSGCSVSLCGDGSRIAIGAHSNDGGGFGAGHVRVYRWRDDSWRQLGEDIDGEAPGDCSGGSVALSTAGDRLAVGASQNAGNGPSAGHVRVFQWHNSAWTQLGKDIDGEAAGDLSGESVALSSDGSRLAIGAPGNSENGTCAGNVRVFEWKNVSWTKLGDDLNGEAAFDLSGSAVTLSASGDIVAVGARGHSHGSAIGSVRVYQWENGSWRQLGKAIDGKINGETSGFSIALSSAGNRLAIGSPGNAVKDPAPGLVRVFEWRKTSWVQLGENLAGESARDDFGCCVSLSSDGSRLVVGAPGDDGSASDAGQIRIFEWSKGSWTQLGENLRGEAAYDRSGSSVALSLDGSRCAVGAIYNEGGASCAGQVRAYQLPVHAQNYVPVKLEGHNHDLVAEGSGDSPVAVTSAPFDSENADGNYVLYTRSFCDSQNGKSCGLPNDGRIRSEGHKGVRYQFQNYAEKNALLLTGNETGTLTLCRADVCDMISVLAASSEGASDLTLRVNYSDQTVEERRIRVPDWVDGAGYAMKGIGRVKRTEISRDFDDRDEYPRLYDILINVDETKIITHLQFIKEASASRTGIFAVCGMTRSGVPSPPVAMDATEITPTDFTIGWTPTDPAVAYFVDIAEDPEFTQMLSSYNNRQLGDVTTHRVDAAGNTLYYRVRAANAVGQSVSSNVVTVQRGITGVEPIPNTAHTLYPNPTRGKIIFVDDTHSIQRLLLTDALGRVVLECSDVTPRMQIDLSAYLPGLYFLHAHGSRGTVLRRIIKR